MKVYLETIAFASFSNFIVLSDDCLIKPLHFCIGIADATTPHRCHPWANTSYRTEKGRFVHEKDRNHYQAV